jgi:hypothetical protein
MRRAETDQLLCERLSEVRSETVRQLNLDAGVVDVDYLSECRRSNNKGQKRRFSAATRRCHGCQLPRRLSRLGACQLQ